MSFQNGDEVANQEVDQFQGSTFGVTLSGEKSELLIRRIWSGLAGDLAGLKKGDLILKIDSTDMAQEPRVKLRKLLTKTAPGTKLNLTILRDGKEMEVPLVTDSKSVRDAYYAANQLEENRVIKKYLQQRKQENLLENFADSIIQAARKAPTPRTASEAINQKMDELNVSHTGLIPKWGYQRLLSRASGGLGITIQRIKIDNRNAYFVADIVFGSNCYKSNLKLGDEILSVNGVEIEKSSRLLLAGEEQRHQLFDIRSDIGEKIKIQFRKLASSKRLSVELETDKDISAVTATQRSASVLEVDANKFGYIRLWNLMSGKVTRILKDAIEKKFQDCDGLVLDLRGRGGQINVVLAIERTLRNEWEKPIVVITDKFTRSAKEILAHRLKEFENVIVIGERTTGAVTAASFLQLPSGDGMMFPVATSESLAHLTDGVALEGNGVQPDEPVKFSLPYSQGRDALLEYATKRISQEVLKDATAK